MSLDELYATVKEMGEDRYRDQKFAAALKGVDLDENKDGNESSFERAKKRADARLQGIDPDSEQAEVKDLADLGLVMAKEDEW